MVEIPKNRIQENFSQNLGLSLLAHALIVAAFSIKFVFFPTEPLIFESAVRVDMVGLPEKTQHLPPPMEPDSTKPVEKQAEKTPPPKPEEKAINLNKTKDNQKKALDKIKAESAIEKLKREMAEKEKASQKPTTPQPVRGNILSPGTSLTGLNKIQSEQYLGTIDQHIKQHWSIPEFMLNRDYKARIKIQIDENGYVISKTIVRSSGNIEYDNFAIETIQKSSPLPPPPEKFRDIVRYDGVVVGFPE